MQEQRKYVLKSAFFVAIVGTLLPFLYNFTGQHFLAGLISPTNESTWEHMKLIFFPMLVANLWLYRKLASTNDSVSEGPLLAGILLGTWLIPVLFYTYKGILGYDVSVLDIATFYISVTLSYLFIWHTFSSKWKKSYINTLFALCFIQLLAFLFYFYHPGTIGIFVPPL